MRQTEESKQFFFAKKNQRTLVYKALTFPRRVHQMDKSFCFFFQKEVLSSCRCVSLNATWYKARARGRCSPALAVEAAGYIRWNGVAGRVMQFLAGSRSEVIGVAARRRGRLRLACVGVLEHALRSDVRFQVRQACFSTRHCGFPTYDGCVWEEARL
jgi:hypothetical protein